MRTLIEIVILLSLAFAPWQGSYALFGGREAFPALSGIGLSWFGVTNLISVGLQFMVVATLFFLFKIWKSWRIVDFLFFAPLLLLFTRTELIDRYTLVLAQGYLLITAFLFLIVWVKSSGVELPLVKKYGPVTLVSSALCSLLFPLWIPIEGKALYSLIWGWGVERYKGWHEFPSTVAFLSFFVFMVGLLHFDTKKSGALVRNSLALILIPVSIWVTWHATHRTTLLAFILVGATYALLFRRNRTRLVIGILIFLSASAANFIGKVGVKNDLADSLESSLFAKAIDPTREDDDSLAGDGFIVNSSGRMGLWSAMGAASRGHMWLGQGTGSASRWLATTPHQQGFGGQPHSETYRLYFEFGLLGVLMILLAAIPLWVHGLFHMAHIWLFLAGVSAYLLLENPLIHPNWFLIPFFWLVTIEVMRRKEAKIK
jgi:hypothetical protein